MIHKHEWGPFHKTPEFSWALQFAKCLSCGRQRRRTYDHGSMKYAYHMVPRGSEVKLPW